MTGVQTCALPIYQIELARGRLVLARKYDRDMLDPKLFEHAFGKLYLVSQELVARMDMAWKEEMYLEMERLIADARPVSRHMTGLNIIQEIQGDIFAAAATYDGEVITIYPDD